MENKKSVVAQSTENKQGNSFSAYYDNVKAISNPLIESTRRNLLKLYMQDERGINLDCSVEIVAASSGSPRTAVYYDNCVKGEADSLIDYESLSTVSVEIKRGKDCTIHSAWNTFVSNEEYPIQGAQELSNAGQVAANGKIIYL